MEGKSYAIKPLEWSCSPPTQEDIDEPDFEEFTSYDAITTFGGFHIYEYKDRAEWGWCFDEFYDEGSHTVESVAEAKKAAQEMWEQRLSSALTEL